MTSTRRLAVVVLVPIFVLAALAWASDNNDKHVEQKIPWQSDLKATMAQAGKTDKPVLLYFTATWCGPCQQMKKTTWIDDGVVAAAKQYLPVMVDVDEHPDEAQSRGIQAIPTVILLDAKGKELARSVGYLKTEDMTKLLTKNAPASGK